MQPVRDPAAASQRLKLLWLSCGNKHGLIRISQGGYPSLKEHNVPHVLACGRQRHDATHW
jgi:hypothetical protein